MSPATNAGEYFRDRRDAGRRLAASLERFARMHDVVVLALPRGGVPVAYEIALALDAPLDVFDVRKLGVPGQQELAMGAIASGGAIYLNEEVIAALHISRDTIIEAADREKRELERREALYRDGRPPPEIADATVILVDDGLATGASMRAGVLALRKLEPRRVVVAVPVAAPQSCAEVRQDADEVVCLFTPRSFYAVGSWYDDFRQVSDDEVRDLLRRAAQRALSSGGDAPKIF